MNPHRIRPITMLHAAALAALAASGCGRSTTPTSSGSSAAAATTSAVAGIAFDAANTMQHSDSLAHRPYGPGGLFGLPLGIPSGCAYDATAQSFVCGPNTLPNG